MNLKEYQEKAFSTCTPECYTDEYLDLGYLSEVGELAGKLAKRVRGDIVINRDIMHEIGDVAWMISVKARLGGVDLFLSDTYLFMTKINVFDLVYSYPLNRRLNVLNQLCTSLGYDFNKCLEMNIEKLASREKRGTIKGNGDNR